MKSTLFLVALLAVCLLASSCGGSSNSGPQGSLTSGNWVIKGTSKTTAGQALSVGGGLTQSGDFVSGVVNVAVLAPNQIVDCLSAPAPVTFSGHFSGDTLKLTSELTNGEVVTLNLVGTGSFLSGTYAATNSGAGCSDEGTVVAAYVPPMTGHWTGNIAAPDGSYTGFSVTADITQGPVTTTGNSPLSGTLSLTDTVDHTVTTSPISAQVSAAMGGGVAIYAGSFVYFGPLTDPSKATQMSGQFRFSPESDPFILTLNKAGSVPLAH